MRWKRGLDMVMTWVPAEEPVKRGPLRKGATKPSTPAGRFASCLGARGATVGRARRRAEQR